MAQVDPNTPLSPICPDSFEPANFNGDVCSLLQQLLLTNEKLYGLLKWMFDQETSGCKLSAAFAANLLGISTPIGSGFWSPYLMEWLPADEWVPADGRLLDKVGPYAALYKAFGANRFKPDTATQFYMPDLSGRMMMMAGTRTVSTGEDPAPAYTVGITGGVDKVKLVEGEIANHRHGMWGWNKLQPRPPFSREANNSDWGGSPYWPSGLVVKNYQGRYTDMGEDVEDPMVADGYTKVHTTTTENVVTIPLTEETDKGDAHENMPPYWPGIYYIRANYKINGVIISMQTP